jgi:hypothetical protein
MDPIHVIVGAVYEETAATNQPDSTNIQFNAPAMMADVLQGTGTVAWTENTSQIADLVNLSLCINDMKDLVVLKEDDALYDAVFSIEEGGDWICQACE